MLSDRTLMRAIKQACQSSGACWAVLLAPAAEGWEIKLACGLSQRMRAELLTYLADFSTHTWLSGALTVGRSRSRRVAGIGNAHCEHLYLFPRKGEGVLLLVGAPALSTMQQQVWRKVELSPKRDLFHVASDGGARTSEVPGGLATRDLSFLKKVLREVAAITDVNRACRHITYLLADHFGCDVVMIWAAQSGDQPVTSIYGQMSPTLQALAERLRQRGKSRLLRSLSRETGVADLGGYGVCAPLDASDSSAGMLFLTRQDAPFSKSDLLMLELVAAMFSGVIANAGQYRSLQDTVIALQEAQQELQARISAQKEAEARLVQAAKLAAVGEMAAGVAHELNNPLTTVVGFTELVMDEMPDDMPQKNDLDMVLREARRARTVVRRLLDFARQSETIRVSADLNELVTDVVALMRHLLHTSGVALRLDLQEGLPWTVMDRNQIKQVILNLMHNALNAIPKGAGEITITTRQRTLYDRPWLTLSVKDNGVGIPPEHIEHIFEPFFTTRSGSGGTGLGLSVTYGIITDHGGRIEVESQMQVGSVFTVWLPLTE
ncbi:MAG: ATP-binding protein [Anaerolineales bacterium]